MRRWDSAKTDGLCSYDRSHRWKAGDRIGVVTGAGWEKRYCADCFQQRHRGGEDSGEVLGTEDAPTYPAPLKAFLEQTRDRFDGRMASAGKDED